ncbi:MAG: biosynthetic-type acetolactate synthase large subunit [Deltaproteobacteria bacterium]|jgi:acetolactate synthase-1/2/3 large subunit|nr:biosynthetic-type acetolactate synthase large subunit [Deltaproteobacteria bacterium]MDH3801304.1 biosynthetic-type acetolactate synthase large subunit [Deltaproteobacteria bacterium]MDH3850518.1 biosynthetic-type acetolactate synthase large subunit [Deltaproteobacteria bacterium]MDH3929008.1 biosynthetic-type acetolactate synthase large subunit [Deltaproteobacteria bacterium]MDH3951215.1 biosynthetic-type acetolactate synthase large subunit [Deltaproteobacteria bacterium]
MKLTGAQIFFESLKAEGVEVIFGLPGGVLLDLYDEMPKHDIRHILVRHEQGAAHMADGYARATGRVGVCLVTSGPGATNTVTGIATAYMDSIPIVVFTGQVPTALIGNDAFQEADIVGITRPCTKHNYLVKDVHDLARIIREAFYLARSGRPGPILVDLPKDVINAKAEYKSPKKIALQGYKPTTEAHMGQIKRAYAAIGKAKKPVIYAGGGVISSNAAKELKQLGESLRCPVTTTLMGLGGFPAPHELWLGMLGMHGTFRANMAMGSTDLLIAIGARFDDRVTGKLDEFAPSAKIIHIDIDPTSISKNVKVDIPIVGDCKDALKKLLQLVKESPIDDLEKVRKPWLDQIQKWKETYPLAYEQKDDLIKPQYVVEKLYELSEGKAIIATEVGQNQMWAAQYYHFLEPRTLLTSGGLGTMGYGLPAAIGAQAAFPDRLVIDVAGDGSIQMCIQEMITAVENNLPVKVAILNNQYLGMVRQWQQLFYEKNYCSTCLKIAPDFVKLAEAYGALGLRAHKPDEVEAVIREGFASPKPVIMDFVVNPEECVYPMVPAGAAMTEMLLA